MFGLDHEIRMLVEDMIDEILRNPKVHEGRLKGALETMGIAQNLDTVLSYTAGSRARECPWYY